MTTMLVMTTIFISKMESLPPTSDIKMIDIWLVVCQMVPFAEVVLLTAMEYNRKDSSNEDEGSKLLKKRRMHLIMENGGNDDDNDQINEEQCQKCWLPELKTLGG